MSTGSNVCACGNPKDVRAVRCAGCSKKSFPRKGAKSGRPSKHQVVAVVRKNTSYQKVAQALGVSRHTATTLVRKFGCDISHFRPGRGRPTPVRMLLSKGKVSRRGTVKNVVLRDKLLEYRCCVCGLGPEWEGRELILELDHKNGDSTDNRLENLRFLCPNCHSQTPTAKGRNYGRYKTCQR